MIDSARAVFFVPGHLKKFKLDLFNRIGATIERKGGRIVRADFAALGELKDREVPIVGCTPELRTLIDEWKSQGRDWIYWDRGYVRRVFATWLPRGDNGGFYRWHLNNFQMQTVADVPNDRWKSLKIDIKPWKKNGKHILILAPTATFAAFHRIEGWTDAMVDRLSRLTDRPLIIRGKETKRPLDWDVEGAHCAVGYGTNALTEAAIMGCPVFTDPSSAASLIGQTDLTNIERPTYPDREPWARSLSYNQFDERELVDGTLWRLLK